MRNIAVAAMLIGLLLGLAACKDIAGSAVGGLGDALLGFPAALAEPSATFSYVTESFSIKTTPADITGYLDYLYRPVRSTYNPLAAQAIGFVDNLLEGVETNIFGNQVVMAALADTGEWASYNQAETEAYRVTQSALTYTVEIWKTVDAQGLKILDLEFTDTGSNYRGTAIAVSDTLGLSERPTYQVDFDTADAVLGKYVELRAVNIQPVTSAANIPRKLWLKAWQDGDGFFVSANIHYVQVDIETTSPFRTQFMEQLGAPAADVQASYIYRGAVDVTTDHGGVSLGLVPASVGTTDTATLFTDYSIGAIYKTAIAAWIRTNPTITTSTGDQALITVINDILVFYGQDALAINTGSNEADIFTALQAVKAILDGGGASSADLDAILFVVKVVNPGYYDGTAGFVGTEELGKPSWAADVPALSGDVGVSAAAIADAAFTVTMPPPAHPDF